jgi:hypothetical protein
MTFGPVTFVFTTIALASVALTIATMISVAYCSLVPSRASSPSSRR